jgi:phage baseplate assembly protein W
MIAFAYPLRIESDGSIATVSGEAVIRTSLAQISGTNGASRQTGDGELPWAPEYGAGLDRLRFAPLGSLLNEAIAARVVGQAARWEPRARVTGVQAESDLASNSASLTVTFGTPSTPRDQVRVQR